MRNTFLLLSLFAALLLLIIWCNPATTKTEKPAPATLTMQKDTATNIFEHLLVDNRKDPSCGMPVKAGISDTVHYKNKVLGFCSKECKETFLKNPEGMIAAAELKK
mgnify:CR=1 FL=1